MLTMVDIPKKDPYEWFDLEKPVKLINNEQVYWGTTTKISEIGAEIKLQEFVNLPENIMLEITEENLLLKAKLINLSYKQKKCQIKLRFELLTLTQYRTLIEMLFCRPGCWKFQQTPGELKSVCLLFMALIKHPIFPYIRNLFLSRFDLPKSSIRNN
jgi:cellulose synthase (UDP-forming)